MTASTVQVEAGKYRLQLTADHHRRRIHHPRSRDPADAADDGVPGAPASRPARNAELVLPGSGLAVSRPSNTISDVLRASPSTLTKADTATSGTAVPPLTFAEPPVTVSVKKDTDGIAAKISALVDAANAARSEAKSLTAHGPHDQGQGPALRRQRRPGARRPRALGHRRTATRRSASPV